jgi:hypothetical protein
MHCMRSTLWGIAVLSAAQAVFAADPSEVQVSHPYRHLAAWLREVEPELADVATKVASRGITVLSNSQRTLKTFDGAAHTLYGASRSTSEVASLRKAAALYEDKSKAEEADRLTELLLVIRKALLAAEWVECGCMDDDVAAMRMANAGLAALPILRRPKCTTPPDAQPLDAASQGKVGGDEWDSQGPSNSDVAMEGPEGAEEESAVEGEAGIFSYNLGGAGGDAGCVSCRPFIDEQRRCVILAFSDNLSGSSLLQLLYAKARPVALASHGLVEETIYILPSVLACAVYMAREVGQVALRWQALNPTNQTDWKIECVGHSFAAAVAATVAGILDGALALRGTETLGEESSSPASVSCTAFGSPPCMSRAVRMSFVTTFVLGDDLIPRTSHKSLRRLKKRLLQVIPRRGGIVGKLGQGLALSSSLVTDVAGVAMQSVRQHSTALESDDLSLPGDVWFLKPRRKKGGATMAQAMTGSLREDMLWQMHDIMLTKSMLSHHQLHKYIETLDRV